MEPVKYGILTTIALEEYMDEQRLKFRQYEANLALKREKAIARNEELKDLATTLLNLNDVANNQQTN